VQNAYNFAQDARISIRGFGATAAFGIRGIKLIVDGIPETTPDGTGQLDNLNLDQVQSLKIIRGSNSSLYGNAAGGAILVNSAFDFARNFVKSSSMFGSYGFYSQSLSGGIKSEKSTLIGHIRYFGYDGFRDHSSFEQVNARLAARHAFNDRLKATFILEYMNSPEAMDPGGITLEDTEANFRQARDRNVTFDAGEEISQWKAGASLEWEWSSNKKLNSYIFFNQRTFDGRLPFENGGIISLKRDYAGIGNSLDLALGAHDIKIGYDLLSQSDDRRRFANLEGVQGDLGFDQQESFDNLGIYILDYVEMDQWYLSGGIRHDWNWLKAVDRFTSNGDDSGDINIANLSYQVGLGRNIIPSLQIFANHSTNFETPTLNQLSNRPDNSGGFEDLKSATASTFESGVRWKNSSFQTEIVGFLTNSKNELVPYELDNREFFRNAGETQRKGLELAASYRNDWLRLYSSYTYSSFEYKTFVQNDENLEGSMLPGIPKHRMSFNLIATPIQSLEISVPIDYVGKLWADDQNSVEVEDYLELSCSIRYTTKLKKLTVSPFAGIRNLTNQRYFDNIRINAFGSRYYEPAPERNFYLGITIGSR
ncbi:MAG: TonB-dependent receptor, partial [Bacteroidota bacterium]